jgi:DNA-binding NtrC family response regulator
MAADKISLPDSVTVAEEERDEGEKEEGAAVSLKTVKADAAREIEEKAILNALDLAHWNKKRAAKILKISYKSLFNKMHSHGINIKRSF